MTPITTAIAGTDVHAALDALGRMAEQITGARLVTLMTADP